jgi:hypothetical protein
LLGDLAAAGLPRRRADVRATTRPGVLATATATGQTPWTLAKPESWEQPLACATSPNRCSGAVVTATQATPARTAAHECCRPKQPHAVVVALSRVTATVAMARGYPRHHFEGALARSHRRAMTMHRPPQVTGTRAADGASPCRHMGAPSWPHQPEDVWARARCLAAAAWSRERGCVAVGPQACRRSSTAERAQGASATSQPRHKGAWARARLRGLATVGARACGR